MKRKRKGFSCFSAIGFACIFIAMILFCAGMWKVALAYLIVGIIGLAIYLWQGVL
ncbi:MAG: hypothetical protein M0R80_07785 [Proteobacteria bacterium]|jgi:uncharacterized membrane protein|nr:hypothetical protein [Pseudomonadota bacterium]